MQNLRVTNCSGYLTLDSLRLLSPSSVAFAVIGLSATVDAMEKWNEASSALLERAKYLRFLTTKSYMKVMIAFEVVNLCEYSTGKSTPCKLPVNHTSNAF